MEPQNNAIFEGHKSFSFWVIKASHDLASLNRETIKPSASGNVLLEEKSALNKAALNKACSVSTGNG